MVRCCHPASNGITLAMNAFAIRCEFFTGAHGLMHKRPSSAAKSVMRDRYVALAPTRNAKQHRCALRLITGAIESYDIAACKACGAKTFGTRRIPADKHRRANARSDVQIGDAVLLSSRGGKGD